MPIQKPYNPNTKYGRRKLREQAEYKYRTGTPEYRKEIDGIGCWVWGIIITIIIMVFFIIALTSGTEAAFKWLK